MASTARPTAASRRATTKPSPPLLPGPHSTTTSGGRTNGPPGPRTPSASRAELGLRHLGDGGAGGFHQRVLGEAQLLRRLVDARHLIGADEHGNAALRARGRIGHRLGQRLQVGDDGVDLFGRELIAEGRHAAAVDALGLRRGAVDPEVDPIVRVCRGKILEVLALRPIGDAVQAREVSLSGQIRTMAGGA